MNRDKAAAFQPLEKKLQRSADIIAEAERRFGRDGIAVAWSGGRDSTALLWMVKSIYSGGFPFRVLVIDTPSISAEQIAFRGRVAKEWNMDRIVVVRAPEAEGAEVLRKTAECCPILNPVVLREDAKKNGIRAVLTGIRWDERPACAGETWFSGGEKPLRVNPLLHFMEKDMVKYTGDNAIPCFEEGQGGRAHGRDAADRAKIIENLRELGYF
jgi:phosphoadenosine phosphosulfate reductase